MRRFPLAIDSIIKSVSFLFIHFYVHLPFERGTRIIRHYRKQISDSYLDFVGIKNCHAQNKQRTAKRMKSATREPTKYDYKICFSYLMPAVTVVCWLNSIQNPIRRDLYFSFGARSFLVLTQYIPSQRVWKMCVEHCVGQMAKSFISAHSMRPIAKVHVWTVSVLWQTERNKLKPKYYFW